MSNFRFILQLCKSYKFSALSLLLTMSGLPLSFGTNLELTPSATALVLHLYDPYDFSPSIHRDMTHVYTVRIETGGAGYERFHSVMAGEGLQAWSMLDDVDINDDSLLRAMRNHARGTKMSSPFVGSTSSFGVIKTFGQTYDSYIDSYVYVLKHPADQIKRNPFNFSGLDGEYEWLTLNQIKNEHIRKIYTYQGVDSRGRAILRLVARNVNGKMIPYKKPNTTFVRGHYPFTIYRPFNGARYSYTPGSPRVIQLGSVQAMAASTVATGLTSFGLSKALDDNIASPAAFMSSMVVGSGVESSLFGLSPFSFALSRNIATSVPFLAFQSYADASNRRETALWESNEAQRYVQGYAEIPNSFVKVAHGERSLIPPALQTTWYCHSSILQNSACNTEELLRQQLTASRWLQDNGFRPFDGIRTFNDGAIRTWGVRRSHQSSPSELKDLQNFILGQ